MAVKTIKVAQLARVEGEGALKVTIRNGAVQEAELNIFEPPRFFEAFLRGRQFSEAPDVTARICGICPVAYQMSAVHAMEDALGVVLLRRAGYPKEMMIDTLTWLLQVSGPGSGGFFATHPGAADRIDAVRKMP